MKKYLLLAILPLLLIGCASNLPLEVKPELVNNFKHEPMPAATETHVYVIRGPSWQGSAYGLEVGLDEKLVSSLASGSHDLIKMDSGYNTLYLSQFGQTFSHKFIDNKKGELLFFYFNPETNEFDKVRPALGKSLVMQTQLTTKTPSRDEAEYYNNALMNPSVMGINLKSADKVIDKKPSKEFALLNIARPSTMLKQFEMAIWSKHELLSVISGEEYTQILIPAGQHKLYTYINGFSELNIEVEAGKTYFAKIDFEKTKGSLGSPWQLVSKWTAFDASQNSGFYKTDFAGLSLVEISNELISQEVNMQRVIRAQKYLKSNITKEIDSQTSKPLISADMGI